MEQPMGRVLRLEYRDIRPKVAADTSIFVVHTRTPEDEVIEITLPNSEGWLVHNATLQFMAVYGIKPSDIDGTSMDVEDWQWLLPLGVNPDGSFGLAAHVLDNGAEKLREAEWFNADDSANDDHDGPGPGAGGGPDPGTGNRGGVDHDAEAEEDVTAELAGEESNAGVNVSIS